MGGTDEGVGRDRGAHRNAWSRRIGVLSAPAPSRGAAAASCIDRGAPGYPSGFEALVDPPKRVYVWGGEWAEPASCAAIVGSRAATPYGLSVAARLARDLAVAGVTVVSGLARGIDSAAHAGALAAGGRTLAVIASGIEQVPAGAPARLAGAIVHSGAVLSEVGRGGPFGKGAFVKRNRLIAASAAVTVVVEAAEDGGGLTTAGGGARDRPHRACRARRPGPARLARHARSAADRARACAAMRATCWRRWARGPCAARIPTRDCARGSATRRSRPRASPRRRASRWRRRWRGCGDCS
jgi:DNA protecting protein DprA